MANVPVYNITDIPTKRAIMALDDQVSSVGGRLDAMTHRNGVLVNQFGLDKAPTQNSDNAVSSGGTYDAIANAVSKEAVTKASVYIQGGVSRTPIFGTITLSRFGRCVTMFVNIANSRPLPAFPTVQTDVTILEATSMPATMKPRVACRFFGGCTYHNSATTAGGTWGYVMLDVSTTGQVRIRGIFKFDGSRVSTDSFLETLTVTGSWQTAG